jgi:aminoglycoside/choline kinase family phosphotransferase
VTKPTPREEVRASFLKNAGWGAAERSPLPGDASTRRYIRLNRNDRSAMLMDQPQNAEAPIAAPTASPEERRALGYNAMARLAGADCGRFVAVANYLRGRGLAAPEIYDCDPKEGFVLLEDLGSGLYVDELANGADETALYAAAIDALVALHAEEAPSVLAPTKPLFDYDETAMLAETDLMTDWFLQLALNRPAREDEIREHRALWRQSLASFAKPAVFVHRDYHVFNLFWLPARSGSARVGMIDFQDALAGGVAYDLVSLLEDARREVTPEFSDAMTARYLARRRAEDVAVDEAQFRAEAAVLAAQRNAKIIGIFARLWKRDGKPRYLGYIPRVWRYMERDLAHPALTPLKAWYDRVIPREVRMKPIEAK